MRRVWWLLPLALAGAVQCRAYDTGNATIVVRVRDPTDSVVAGAEVRVRSDRSVVPLSARTDAQGVAVFPGVPAGPVVLVAGHGALHSGTWRREIAAGELVVATVPIEILSCGDPAQVQAPFELHAFWDTRDRVDSTQQELLPSSGNLWSLIETTVPAAVMDRIDGPGLWLGEPARFAMRGASWTQNSIRIGSLDVTDGVRGGTPLAYPGVDAFEAIDLTSALAPVEYGSPGVTVALTPREPSDDWRGQVRAAWAGSGLQAAARPGDAPAVARLGSLADGGAVVSGPVVGQRLRVLLAARASRLHSFERGTPDEVQAKVGSLLAHLVYQASERDALRLLASAQWLDKPFAGRARFSGPAVSERDDFDGAQLAWDRAGERTTLSAFAGLQTGLLQPQTGNRAADRPIERLLDGPVPELVYPSRSRRTTWSAGTSVGLRARRVLGLWHAVRFGATAGGMSASDASGADRITAELVDGQAARVWDYGYAGESRRHAFDVGAYAADRVVFRDRVFVEAGLRLDASHGSAQGALQGISWTAVSPRVSARLLLTRFGHFSLVGGYGEYRHRMLLDALAFGDPNGPQGSVYLWHDTNGDGVFEPTERGALVERVGPGSSDGQVAAIDPSLKPSRTREFVVGIESQPGDGWSVGLTGFDRRERDLIEPVDVGVPLSSYDVSYVPDPAGDLLGSQDDQLLPIYSRQPASFGLDRYVLTNPTGDASKYQGVELRVRRSFGNLRALVGALAYRTEVGGANRGFRVFENDQGVIGERYDDPNAGTYAVGRGFFDRSFAIKISLSYEAPRGWSFGTVARYQDGQPFARVVIAPDLGQGVDAIPATPRGQLMMGPGVSDAQGRYIVPSGHRFTFTTTWDARVEKRFRLGAEQRVALAVEVFNLLNLHEEVEENVVTGPAFRTPTAIQPPRTFRCGLRYEF